MSRLFLVASWIVLGAVCLGMSAYFPDADNIPLYFWMVGSVALFGVQFLISINERDSWGSRVARTIPRNRLLRFFAFLFYSGAAGGVSLAVLCVVLTLCAGLYWQMLFPARHFGEGSEIILSVSAALGLYVFCYSMTAVLLRVYVLRDRLRVLYNWVLAFLLLAVGSTLPWITVLFFDFDRFGRSAEIQWWMLPNPFDALYKIGPGHDYYAPGGFTLACFVFLGVWSLSLTVLSVSWFGQQIARFHPPAPRVRIQAPVPADARPVRRLLPRV